MKTKKLTKRQKQVIGHIVKFQRKLNRMPTGPELAKEIKVAKAQAYHYLSIFKRSFAPQAAETLKKSEIIKTSVTTPMNNESFAQEEESLYQKYKAARLAKFEARFLKEVGEPSNA